MQQATAFYKTWVEGISFDESGYASVWYGGIDGLKMLCRCGNIVSAIIEKDPSGNPRGVAVVEFEEESSRKTALTLSGERTAH